jgi:20S proteasome subunit beta 7
VVAGIQEGEPFVGFVSMIGVSYSDNYVTTGFASHLGLPLMREHYRPDMSEQEAIDLMQKALKVISQLLSGCPLHDSGRGVNELNLC